MKKYYRVKSILLLGFIGFSLRGHAQSGAAKDTSVVKIDYSPKAFEPGPLLSIPQKRSIVSYATTTGDVLGKTPVASISNTLYGRLNGLMVAQGSGEPGYDAASLSVRGRGTYDNSSLIYYVDGFQVDYSTYFVYLSTGEIEGISLLKDPVTLATFGVKGANGVVWVTTKRGKAGKPTINAQVVSGIQQAIKINKPYDAYDYARLYNEAVSNDNYSTNGYQYNWTPAYTDAQLQAYKNGTGTNVDWYDRVLNKNAKYTDANVDMMGGNDQAKYNLFIGYTGQTALYDVPKGSALTANELFQRFTLRSNIDLKFFKIFEARIDLGGRIEDRRYPNGSSGIWGTLETYPNNIYPVKDSLTGNWSGTTTYPNNPVAQLDATGIATYHVRTLQGNFNLKENLGFVTPGLYLNEAVSFNTWTQVQQIKSANYARYTDGSKQTNDNTTVISFGGNIPWGQLTWEQSNLTAGYDRTFGDHAISGALNYYASQQFPDANTVASNLYHHFENMSGRVNYAYKSRYVADFGFGYSGSDNYAPGNQWSFYPALALGWVVSKESFLEKSKLVDLLKLRASVGQSGNDQTNNGRYLYRQYLNYSGGITTGNNGSTGNGGLFTGLLATPGITAEKSLKYNLGFDLSLLHKISVNADLFLDKRSGIITQNNFVPGYYGYTGVGALTGSSILPFQNIGKMTNKGVEIGVDYSDRAGAFTYGIGGAVTYAKNKIDYMAEIPNKNGFTNATGQPFGTSIGLVATGFYQSTDFNPDGTLKTGLPAPAFGPVQPGDIKYKDLDNNGVVDNNDRTKIGNPNYPNLYYSFNLFVGYKGFDLSAVFQGESGVSINLLNSAYSQVVPFVGNTTIYRIAGNAWAYYPGQGIDTRNTATFPRLSTLSNSNNYIASTFWMKSGDFLRLRNVQLAYNIPASVTKRMHLERLKIFVSAVNPVIWSSFYKKYNMDPETPSGYPGIKSYNGGISLTL